VKRRKNNSTSGNSQLPPQPTAVPVVPAGPPTTEAEKSPTEFEKLKAIFLNNRYIAFLLLLLTVFGLGIKQISDSFDFFKRFRAPVVSVKASARQYDSSPATFLTIPLTITLVSADRDQISDVKIRVSAEELKDDGTSNPVSDDDFKSDFIVDGDSVDVGAIDTKTGATPHDLKMMIDASGEYRLRIAAMSGGKEVGSTQVAISAISQDVQDAIKKANTESPIILVKHDGVINPWPVDYRKLTDFTLLLLREYNEKEDTDRASLRLQAYYLGSCPMNCRIGYGDLGGAKMADSIGDPPAKNLTALGLMNYAEVNRFPIGTRIYQIDYTDDGRWTIKDVTSIACAEEKGTSDKEASFHGEERTWRFKSQNLTAKENVDCGVGRICVTEVSLGGQTFTDVDSHDESEGTRSDFPAFFDIKQGSVKRVHFDDDGVLTIDKCSLYK
jgi:hypothetical protein